MTTPATSQAAKEAAVKCSALANSSLMIGVERAEDFNEVIQRAIDSEIDRSLKLITQPEGANK